MLIPDRQRRATTSVECSTKRGSSATRALGGTSRDDPDRDRHSTRSAASAPALFPATETFQIGSITNEIYLGFIMLIYIFTLYYNYCSYKLIEKLVTSESAT